jgi:hypothetical protein
MDQGILLRDLRTEVVCQEFLVPTHTLSYLCTYKCRHFNYSVQDNAFSFVLNIKIKSEIRGFTTAQKILFYLLIYDTVHGRRKCSTLKIEAVCSSRLATVKYSRRTVRPATLLYLGMNPGLKRDGYVPFLRFIPSTHREVVPSTANFTFFLFLAP